MLRAKKIPSRIILGFAHVETGFFFGHAWVEVFLNSHWVGIDAAMNQFPTDPMRIKLIHLNGESDLKVAATNVLLRSLSQIQIEILGAEKNGKTLPLVPYPENMAKSSDMLKKIFSSIFSE